MTLAGGTGRAAREYHESTKHSSRSVRRVGHSMDWSNRPHPFRVYEGLDGVPLPQALSLGVSAREALAGITVSDEVGDIDLIALARLLRYGAGVLRRKAFGPGEVLHFRTYASAGALYPVEVYVACAGFPGLEAGMYHFDPQGFRLVRLRDGDYRAQLARASAAHEAVARASTVLVLTGIPWRTAWKYGERGYRHLFWDAGMILANLLALAASAGLGAEVVTGFADAEIEALLGLDGTTEFPLCLLPVGGSRKPVFPSDEPPVQVSFEVLPLSRRPQHFPAIQGANEAGRLLDPHDVSHWRERSRRWAPDTRGGEEGVIRSAESDPPGDPLEEVIRRRGSARVFTPGSISGAVLGDILDVATGPIPTDGPAPGLIEVYLIANAVDGLEGGTYAFARGGFVSLRRGDFRREAAYLCLEQRLAGDAAATIFLMADLDAVLRGLGDRGYSTAQLEAGIVGGRIYLGAYAHRFGASGLTFYDDDVTKFFSPHAAGKDCMLVMVVGKSPRLAREAPTR